jgi:hypothetical protein
MANQMHVNRNRENLGVFPLEEVRVGLKSGRFLPDDLGWMEGMAEWKPLAQIPQLSIATSEVSRIEMESSLDHPGLDASVVDPTLTVEPAWERRSETGIFPALIDTVRSILGRPGEVFSAMPKSGGYKGPLFFWLLIGMITGAVAMFYQVGLWMVNPESLGPEMESFGPAVAMGIFLAYLFVILPILLLVGIFISAAITHLFLLLVGGAKESFETTFRVLAYAYGSTSVLQMVPFCGSLIYSIWGLIASIIGLARAHNTEVSKVIIAVLLPLILFCGCLIAIFFFAAGGLLEAMQHAGVENGNSGHE